VKKLLRKEFERPGEEADGIKEDNKEN